MGLAALMWNETGLVMLHGMKCGEGSSGIKVSSVLNLHSLFFFSAPTPILKQNLFNEAWTYKEDVSILTHRNFVHGLSGKENGNCQL